MAGKFPFKTIDIHPNDLKRILTPEPLKTAPTIENPLGILQYNT